MDENTLPVMLRTVLHLHFKPAPLRGSGLGLPAVRNVAVVEVRRRLHTFGSTSEPGAGTTFPRSTSTRSKNRSRRHPPNPRLLRLRRLNVRRVLVADDDEEIRRLVERVLAHNGHHVTIAESGEDALAALAGRSPEELLLTCSRDGDVDMIGNERPLELRTGIPGFDAVPIFRCCSSPATRSISVAPGSIRPAQAISRSRSARVRCSPPPSMDSSTVAAPTGSVDELRALRPRPVARIGSSIASAP